ncbi:FabD/lysophospholipase-like protein, partial [Aulographum hederae CBS 113979]
DPWARKSVLAIDGGGIRGYASLCVLKLLMADIEKVEKQLDAYATWSGASPFVAENKDRKYWPYHYFDYISGTSTGGLIAVMLGRLHLTVDQAIANYKRMWTTFTEETSTYSLLSPLKSPKAQNTVGLSKALDKILESKVMQDIQRKGREESSRGGSFASDSKMCRTIVLVMELDAHKGMHRPYLFRSYEPSPPYPSSTLRPPRLAAHPIFPLNISSVCHATSAAPRYFKPVKLDKFKFCDGSMWTTNPAIQVYREVRNMHADLENPIDCLVSVGCGRSKQFRSRFAGVWKGDEAEWEPRTVHETLSKKGRKKGEFTYHRIPGPEDMVYVDPTTWRADRKRDEQWKMIEEAVEEYCRKPEIELIIRDCTKRLVETRQRRANTTSWETFALGKRFLCRICKIEKSGATPPLYEDRDDFIDHLIRSHNKHAPDENHFQEVEGLLDENAQ